MTDEATGEAQPAVEKVHPDKLPGTLFINHEDTPISIQQVGRLADNDGKLQYLLGYVTPGFIPAVQSAKTGHVYLFPWHEIATLAIEKGVDQLHIVTPPEKKLIIPGA